VVLVRAVLDRFTAGGGGLAASGIAFAALFALAPGMMFLIGVAGLLISDPADRAAVIDQITELVPPVRDIVGSSLDQLASEARSVSIIGLVGLAWGASRFYRALEDGLGRILAQGHRNFLARMVLGLASVLVLVAAIVGGVMLSVLTELLEEVLPQGPDAGPVRPIAEILGIVARIAVLTAAIALVYRFVPRGAVAWRSILLPSVAVSIAISILTQAFVFLAPRLIGAAAVLGTLATIFAALAWMSLVFQALLLGAAWIAEREARHRARTGAPPITLGTVTLQEPPGGG
jgi:membrane protein